MIALNELLSNLELYESMYKQKGIYFNPSFIVQKSEQLKKTQLEIEQQRSACNKLCQNTIQNKIKNKEAKSELKAILKLNKKIARGQRLLQIQTKQINNELKLLHNLPEDICLLNTQINTTQKTFSSDISKKFIFSLGKVSNINKSQTRFYKKMKNRIILQNELPLIFQLKKSIVIFVEKGEQKQMLEKIVTFFTENALSVIKLAVTELSKESAVEYFVHLSKNEHLKIKLLNEFKSREFNIKYRDKNVDATKFINQINIEF